MSADVTTEHEAERSTTKIPFPRNRFLTVTSAALFGTATKLLAPDIARATHQPPPGPCEGCNKCDCCVAGPGCTCCDGGGPCYNCGCITNPSSACWYTCASGFLWKCCDFKQGGRCCICAQYIGTVCG
jgi:hypothetical protein